MADEDRASGPAGNSWVHDPLPYVVRLRVIVSEDRPGDTQEIRTVAYSLGEAVMQAIYETAGRASPDVNYKIEAVGPDLAALAARAALALAGGSRGRR